MATDVAFFAGASGAGAEAGVATGVTLFAVHLRVSHQVDRWECGQYKVYRLPTYCVSPPALPCPPYCPSR